jgi:peptide deformylase
MTRLPIYVTPHPVLRQIAQPVETVTDDIRRLMNDMLDSMYANNGIGLAAPQVGVLQRVVVMDLEQRDDDDGKRRRGTPLYFINPEVVWTSEEVSVYNEGCLSVPAQYGDVTRPAVVRVRYLDENGTSRETEADGLFATCMQHEIDHLNGILFIDHLSKLKRDMVLKKLGKWVKDHAEDITETHILG